MIDNLQRQITCTMVTVGRFALVCRSIECYLKQTYSKRDLVIISQGAKEDNQLIQDYVSSLGREDILFLSAPRHLTLGALRNLSIEVARGDVICQWDDDDLYHPGRLSTQYNALLACPQAVASLCTEFIKLFLTVEQKRAMWCVWTDEIPISHRYLPGSVMFHKSVFHQASSRLYPEWGKQANYEEDLNLIDRLMQFGELAPVPYGNLYVYVYHGRNAYDLTHHYRTVNSNSKKYVLGGNSLLQKQKTIVETFQLLNLDQKIQIGSLDEDLFTYDPEAA